MTLRTRATFLFFALLVTYAATASYTTQSIDTASMYYPAWQLAHHGNVSMDAFAHLPLWWVQTGERIVSNRFPGATWLATPLYLLDQSTEPSAAMGNLAAAAATAGAVVVFFLLARRLVSDGTALAASLVLAFATPTWTVSADALWTHGPGQFWLLLGLLLTVREQHFRSGVAFGAAVLTRPHYGIVAAVIGLWDFAVTRRRSPIIRIAAGTALGCVLLLVYNKQVFDTWHVDSGGYVLESPLATGAAGFAGNLAGFLFSPSRGVFVLTPFLLVLVPGLRAAWIAAPTWARAGAVGGSLYTLAQLALNRFSGGYGFFSYRLALELVTLSAPLLLLAYQCWVRPRRRTCLVFHVLLVYSFVTHAIGAVAFEGEAVEPDYWRTWGPASAFTERPETASATAVLSLLIALGVAAWWRRTAREDADVA